MDLSIYKEKQLWYYYIELESAGITQLNPITMPHTNNKIFY